MDYYQCLVSLFYHYFSLSVFIYSTTPPMNSCALQLCLHLITFYFFISTIHAFLWTIVLCLYSSNQLHLLCSISMYDHIIFLLINLNLKMCSHLHLLCTPMETLSLYIIILFVSLYLSTQLHLLWHPLPSNFIPTLKPLVSSSPPPVHSYGLLASSWFFFSFIFIHILNYTSLKLLSNYI